MLRANTSRDRRAICPQRMQRGSDHLHPNAKQPLLCQLTRGGRQRADNTKGTTPVQHRLDGRAQGLDIDAQRRVREFRLKRPHRYGQQVDGEQDVDDDRQFGFKAISQLFGLRLEQVHVVDDGTRPDDQGPAMFGRHWLQTAAVEQRHADLSFQIGQRLADDGLRPPQTPASGEASCFDGGEEGAELIKGNGFQHIVIADRVYLIVWSITIPWGMRGTSYRTTRGSSHVQRFRFSPFLQGQDHRGLRLVKLCSTPSPSWPRPAPSWVGSP